MTKKTCAGLTTLAALGLTAAANSVHAQTLSFTAGDLVVSQVGVTGSTTALSSAATADVLDEFTTGGSLAGSLALPTAAGNGNNPFTNSGTATSEGALTLSTNGQYLLLGGFDAASGVAGVASTTSANTPREIATVNAAGTVNDSTALTNAFSGSSSDIRSAASANGITLFAGGTGTNAGVQTAGAGSTTSTQIEGSTTNVRDVNYVGSTTLYYSTGSATGNSGTGIYRINTTSNTTAGTLIAADTAAVTGPPAVAATGPGATGNPYGFYFTPDGTYLYVADTMTTTKGAILKYSTTTPGTGYTFDYSLSTGVNGVTGLTGITTGTGATEITMLYGVDPTTLFSVADNDMTLSAATTLYTAAKNTAFRGIAFAPQALTSGSAAPEPSQVGMLALMGLGLGGLMLRARRRTVAA